MVTVAIWWAGILLEAIVLYRGLRSRLVTKYPFFYLYVASVFLADASLYFVRMTSPAVYASWNWLTVLLNLILGYGIILDIFKHAFGSYPGVERLAKVSSYVIFGAIFGFLVIYPLVGPSASPVSSTVQLERDFWTVQVMFLLAVLGVVAYYGIPIGTNLKGIIFGYCLGHATTLMMLALRSYIGPSFRVVSNLIEPLAYLISLVIWVITLWSEYPEPVSESGVRLEADYESLMAHTRVTLGAMRSYLVKAVRQ